MACAACLLLYTPMDWVLDEDDGFHVNELEHIEGVGAILLILNFLDFCRETGTGLGSIII